jgi:hypothetical protein
MLSVQEKQYAQTFIRDFKSPHARQQPGKDWRTYYKNISDPLIQAHLAQHEWLGAKACWYPVFFNLDIDSPTPKRIAQIEERLDCFGIGSRKHALVTTPSYQERGNFRIYIRVEHNERPVTWRRGYEAMTGAFGDLAEVYPQKRRKDRLPCGRDQHPIDFDGRVHPGLSWGERMAHLFRIEATPLDNFPRQQLLFNPHDNTEPAAPTGDAAGLLIHGLQAPGTRHMAQFQVLNLLWRSNWQPQDAAQHVKRWLRAKHNGFSKEVSAGRWGYLHKEIDRQVGAIWSRSRLPDSPNNITAAVHKADLIRAAKLFPGDAVRQKQFINLIAFARPRHQHHPWLFISRRLWTEEIAGSRTTSGFIAELESKGLLEIKRDYLANEFSRRYKLKLPKTDDAPIQSDNRNATDYYEALRFAFNDDLREISDLTKLDRTTLWRNFRQEKCQEVL